MKRAAPYCEIWRTSMLVCGPAAPSNTMTSPVRSLRSDMTKPTVLKIGVELLDSGPKIRASAPNIAASAIIFLRKSSKLSNTVELLDLRMAITV